MTLAYFSLVMAMNCRSLNEAASPAVPIVGLIRLEFLVGVPEMGANNNKKKKKFNWSNQYSTLIYNLRDCRPSTLRTSRVSAPRYSLRTTSTKLIPSSGTRGHLCKRQENQSWLENIAQIPKYGATRTKNRNHNRLRFSDVRLWDDNWNSQHRSDASSDP